MRVFNEPNSNYFKKSSVLLIMSIFRILIIACLIFSLTSCDDDEGDNYVKKRVPVRISQMIIPGHGSINLEIEISLRAEAENGCYRDLEFTVTETDERHYLFTATALFESYGVCPEVFIYKDTIVNFNPVSAGEYYFQANDSFRILKDTLVVARGDKN